YFCLSLHPSNASSECGVMAGPGLERGHIEDSSDHRLDPDCGSDDSMLIFNSSARALMRSPMNSLYFSCLRSGLMISTLPLSYVTRTPDRSRRSSSNCSYASHGTS